MTFLLKIQNSLNFTNLSKAGPDPWLKAVKKIFFGTYLLFTYSIEQRVTPRNNNHKSGVENWS